MRAPLTLNAAVEKRHHEMNGVRNRGRERQHEGQSVKGRIKRRRRKEMDGGRGEERERGDPTRGTSVWSASRDSYQEGTGQIDVKRAVTGRV